MVFIQQNSKGVSLKLMKILCFTSNHYEKTRSARNNMVSIDYQLNYRDWNNLEQTILKESSILTKANRKLHQLYRNVSKRWTRSSIKLIREFIFILEAKYNWDIAYLRTILDSLMDSKGNLEFYVKQVNGDKKLTQDEEKLVKMVCSVTTYLIHDKRKRVEYVKVEQKRRENPRLKVKSVHQRSGV